MSFDRFFHALTPFGLLDQDAETLLTSNGVGAVIARPGVGKTAFLVQLAIYYMFKEKNVIHISIQDSIKKMCLWYEEIRRNVRTAHNLDLTDTDWESLLQRRFVVSHKPEAFSISKIETQLNALAEQGIFKPEILILDGLELDAETFSFLSKLKTIIDSNHLRAWLSFRSDLPSAAEAETFPENLRRLVASCECAFLLRSVEKAMRIDVIRCGAASSLPRRFLLDPTNLLLKNLETP